MQGLHSPVENGLGISGKRSSPDAQDRGNVNQVRQSVSTMAWVADEAIKLRLFRYAEP
jgi:hypothetical protein